MSETASENGCNRASKQNMRAVLSGVTRDEISFLVECTIRLIYSTTSCSLIDNSTLFQDFRLSRQYTRDYVIPLCAV